MEIDVTLIVMAHLGKNPIAKDCSGSVMEHGENAASFTYKNSCELGMRIPIIRTESQEEAFNDHFKSYGAWTMEEIKEWTYKDRNGLMVQEVMSAVRHLEAMGLNLAVKIDEDVFVAATENEGGQLYQSGAKGEEWWYYLGS